MTKAFRAEISAGAWRSMKPAVILPPEEIAGAVLKLVQDEHLAGRVMLCYEGRPWRLVPPGKAV